VRLRLGPWHRPFRTRPAGPLSAAPPQEISSCGGPHEPALANSPHAVPRAGGLPPLGPGLSSLAPLEPALPGRSTPAQER
jgi:hypothetical protein